MDSLKSKWAGIPTMTAVVAVVMAAYHMLSTQILPLSYVPHLNLHLAFGLSIVFLQSAERNKKLWLLFFLALLLSLLATGYIFQQADELVDREQMPNQWDSIVGIILVVAVILAAYEAFGPILPIMAIIGIAYAFLGPYCPRPFFHAGVGPIRLVAMLTTDLDGIYGTLLFISATYMAIFLTLGSFIENSGAARFFIDLPLAIFRNVKAGGGYAAVLASALMGMGSGSPVANVVTTGTFTIPLMKRQGFMAHTAGGIEAAASTGGQIMPPVMGAVAFVMAEFTSTPYVKIMGYATVPAILYFLAVGFSVHFRAEVRGLATLPSNEIPEVREALKNWRYLLPIFVLVFILVVGYTPSLAAFWAIVAMVLVSIPRRPDAAFAARLWKCFEHGGRRAAEFAAAMACISIFVKIIMATGVGLKLPILIADYAGRSLFMGYVWTAVASAILGMGLPTVAAYIVVAVLAVPALTDLGANEIQAHFFVLYFSILSALTPPVALAALAGAKVAEADYVKTSWASLKYGYLAFIIPFLFAYNPALMALGPWGEILLAALGTLLACICTSACLQGHFLRHTSLLDRALLAAAAACFFIDVVHGGFQFLVLGIAFALAALMQQRGWTSFRL